MDDLGHHLAAVFVDRIGDPGEPGTTVVAIDEELGRLLPAVCAHRHVAGDDESHPTVGEVAVDIDQPLVDAPVGIAESLPGRRPHQPVAEARAR